MANPKLHSVLAAMPALEAAGYELMNTGRGFGGFEHPYLPTIEWDDEVGFIVGSLTTRRTLYGTAKETILPVMEELLHHIANDPRLLREASLRGWGAHCDMAKGQSEIAMLMHRIKQLD